MFTDIYQFVQHFTVGLPGDILPIISTYLKDDPHQFTTRIINVLFIRVLILVPPLSFTIFPLNYSLVQNQPSHTTVIVSSSTLTK